MNIYAFGKCKKCGKYLPLKNDLCINCQDNIENLNVPDFLKDLFRKKNNDS